MANNCTYIMKIKGEHYNIHQLLECVRADYNSSVPSCTAPHHLFRVFNCIVDGDYDWDENTYLVEVSGDCAWSVAACMTENGMYYRAWKGRDPYATTIDRLSKIYNCDVEIYSYEPGCEIAEHYYIKSGKFVIGQTISYEECWFDDYENKRDAEYDFDIYITEDEWRKGFKVICDYDFANLNWEIGK